MLHVTKLTFIHKVSLQHYSTHAATGRYANQKLVIDQGMHSVSNCKEVHGVPNRLDSSGQIGMVSQKNEGVGKQTFSARFVHANW